MIVENKHGKNILESGEKHIAFGVNTEGCNDSGFAGIVASRYLPELAYIGEKMECKLGTVLTKNSDDGITFYALVCHSLKDGWNNQSDTIKQCFDAIECDEKIASIAIGTGFVGMISGANFKEIKDGMERSKAKIILY